MKPTTARKTTGTKPTTARKPALQVVPPMDDQAAKRTAERAADRKVAANRRKRIAVLAAFRKLDASGIDLPGHDNRDDRIAYAVTRAELIHLFGPGEADDPTEMRPGEGDPFADLLRRVGAIRRMLDARGGWGTLDFGELMVEVRAAREAFTTPEKGSLMADAPRYVVQRLLDTMIAVLHQLHEETK